MGVGKTTVCQQLKRDLQNSVFLDGDWCWDASPFQVTDETKAIVIDNICYLLNNSLKCSVYENIIFCWVMHEQSIINSIIEKLDTKNCAVNCISLVANKKSLPLWPGLRRPTSNQNPPSGSRPEHCLQSGHRACRDALPSRIPLYKIVS